MILLDGDELMKRSSRKSGDPRPHREVAPKGPTNDDVLLNSFEEFFPEEDPNRLLRIMREELDEHYRKLRFLVQ
jgi:hypothetical protein